MAKISDAERHKYSERIKSYKAAINTILGGEKESLVLINKASSINIAALKRFALVNEMLNLASNYIIINGISQSVLKVKNEEALNEGRKSLYKGIIYLEGVVSNYIDAPFSDYEDKLAEIESISAAERYFLVRKIGLAIQLLENAYGDNSKWRWAFVELEGRYATVAKNIIDLKNAVVNTDPRSVNYEPTVYLLRLVKKLLSQAGDRYREKYELSTSRIDDFKQGISFLSALRRLYIVFGDREAETVKKKLDSWSAKLEKDLQRQKEAKNNTSDLT